MQILLLSLLFPKIFTRSLTHFKSETVLVDSDISELALAKMVKTAIKVFLSFSNVLGHEV